MKKMISILMIFALASSLVACGNSLASNGADISSEINAASAVDEYSDAEENVAAEDATEQEISILSSDLTVDYDLTTMSSDMVYAIVYQMMVNPDDYMGATVCMSGQYYASYFDVTDNYYHYCIIADATSCCSQGMEFVLGDSSRIYPDDYPSDGEEIVVIGTFGTYDELDVTYHCLLDATIVGE